MDTSKPYSSVAVFRLGCMRIMSMWAREWMRAHHGKSDTDTQRWLLTVQLAYFDVLRRNPTLQEWVCDLLYASSFNAKKGVMHSVVASRKLPADPFLLIMKPYFFRYHAAKKDMHDALQTFSRDVGRVFVEAEHRRMRAPLDPDEDWGDVETIRAFIAGTKTTFTTNWRRRVSAWWTRFLTH